MTDSTSSIVFGQKVRVRVCGVLINDNKILLAKHRGIGESGHLWIPPGGGVEFAETCKMTLIREFKEETDMDISVGELMFINEHIDSWFHAIELFFEVKWIDGQLKLGMDPELPDGNQVLEEVSWVDLDDLDNWPKNTLHRILHNVKELTDVERTKCILKK